jgi:cell division transport system permease protein
VTHSIREALAAFRRAPLLVLVSMVAVGLSLFVIGLFGLTAYNIRTALREIEDRVEVVAYLRDQARLDEAKIVERDLIARPEVLEVRYVSRTEALATAVEELTEFQEAFAGLESNLLPASLEIRLRPGYRTPEATERLARDIRSYPIVEDVLFGRDWVRKIVSLQQIAAGATVVLGGAFALVAGIIIAAAIRIAVFARRDEIEIMRLVGATDSFIRRPFLIEGILTGLFGGIAAVGLTYLAYYLVNDMLIEIRWIPGIWLVVAVAAGAAYGLVASAVAVRRHLRAL